MTSLYLFLFCCCFLFFPLPSSSIYRFPPVFLRFALTEISNKNSQLFAVVSRVLTHTLRTPPRFWCVEMSFGFGVGDATQQPFAFGATQPAAGTTDFGFGAGFGAAAAPVGARLFVRCCMLCAIYFYKFHSKRND